MGNGHKVRDTTKLWNKECLLNEAYKMSQAEHHQCLQNIRYLLNIHGFSDIWNNPSTPSNTFQNAFEFWVDDLFRQSIIGKLQSSSRFTAWKEVFDNRGYDSYIHTIRSPQIQTIFLQLRIDMNIFLTSRCSKIHSIPVHSVPENPKQSNISYSSV